MAGANPWDKAYFARCVRFFCYLYYVYKLSRKFYNVDSAFLKPLLTDSSPTLMETMPRICQPLARLLTTQRQLENVNLPLLLD